MINNFFMKWIYKLLFFTNKISKDTYNANKITKTKTIKSPPQIKDPQMLIIRTEYQKIQTLGKMIITDSNGYPLREAKTLERPWLDNHPFISCIPPGQYQIKRRWSAKLKNHLKILNVPGRTNILIHAGNLYIQTEGCVLAGQSFKDINKDGWKDVTKSRPTMKQILKFYKWRKKYKLTIFDFTGESHRDGKIYKIWDNKGKKIILDSDTGINPEHLPRPTSALVVPPVSVPGIFKIDFKEDLPPDIFNLKIDSDWKYNHNNREDG